jgi:hypothetical protein
MSRDNRMKAQDVFANSNYVFGKKTSKFSEAFPLIKNVKVKVEEYDWGNLIGTNYYSESNMAEFINCRNPKCYNGGFRIAEQLRFMEYDKETQKKLEISCQGYEGSPKGRKKDGPCYHDFKVEIEIAYK